MTISQQMDSVVYRLKEIGIPITTAKLISNDVGRWIENNGIEWTIKRLKAIKTDFICYLGNKPRVSTWVKSKHGYPSSSFSYFFKLDRRNKKRIFKAFCALMMYTRWTAIKPTNQQLKKFKSGLDAPSIPSSKHTLAGIRKSANIVKSTRSMPRFDRRGLHLCLYRGSPSKRSPIAGQCSTVPQSEEIGKELQIFREMGGDSLYHRYKELFDPIIEGTSVHTVMNYPNNAIMAKVKDNPPVGKPYRPFSGHISFIQEPGYKLRYVANPYRIFQIALKPLGKAIYDLVSTLPWDCTFDQTKHISHVQNHLKQGKEAHAVDLSSATDFFPFDIQKECLRTLFGDSKDITLFEEVSRNRWKSPIGELQWKQGQPLGLYPSFGAFTLTHGLLLFHLNDYKFNNDFFVVGDDVIILDKDLLHKYRKCLDEMNCPVSEDKCLSSNTLCEFAGKLISQDAVYPQLKWRKLSDENFIDIARNFGPHIRKFMTERQKTIYDIVKGLLPPLGCNHDDGLTYIEKFVKTEEAMNIGQRSKRSVMSLNSHINTLMYNDNDLKHERNIPISNMVHTFDEKVEEVLNRFLLDKFSLSFNTIMNFENIQSMIGGFQTIPDQLDEFHVLPSAFTPGYTSFLVLMERRFLLQ